MRSLIIALALFVASPAVAADCKPLIDFVQEGAQHGLEIKPLPTQIVGPLTEIYNSQPPVSDEHYTSAAYAEFPSGNAVVFLIRGSDVCGHLKVPAAAWVRLKALAFGEGA